MKKILLLLLASFLFTPVLANACQRCDLGWFICKAGDPGGCRCSADGLGVCTTCGTCSGGRCHIQCEPNFSRTKPSKTELAFRQWPWLKDPDLSRNVGAISPVLGRLVEAEQGYLKKASCPVSSVRSGVFRMQPLSTSNKGAAWYSVVSNNKIRYLVYYGYGNQPRELIITKDSWQILQHKRIITEGTFVVQPKQLN